MKLSLLEKFDAFSEEDLLKVDMPPEITGNLSTRIKLRPYQIEALERWFYYISKYKKRPSNPHLLFHMATGSGKTVLMAALILHLYKRGHRNFLFFVNSTQIIEKTKDNFLNQASAKHLFSPIIRIDGKTVDIRVVETFDAVSNETINIHFTTIQGLHTRMRDPKEDAVTIEDFREFQVVMISDEAHHLNAQTKKKLNKNEAKEKLSWEGTVTDIFRQHSENILLEFTATADLNHQAIKEKYHDKILFDYQLKHFREDSYSKDIQLRQADLPPMDRMMQVMILSQYRLKVAEAHRIPCKPVILMKSRTIAESEENETLFASMIKELSGKDLQEMRVASSGDETLSKAFKYILDDRGVEIDDFALELQGAFGDGKIVNVNRPNDLEELQIDLNNLEDHTNDIRVIFAVNKLDEGWDVLNLFDIVRLYDKRDSKGDKIGKTTMSEAQLIGRGARYFPFTVPDQPHAVPEKRKYDRDVKHSLRVLEELYYHCSHNPRYIVEIKRALRKIGMEDENTRIVNLRLKESFKKSKFYKIGYVWVNERVENPRDGIDSLRAYDIRVPFTYPALMTGRVTETSAFDEEEAEESQTSDGPVLRSFRLSDFSRSILDFAMDSNHFFHFVSLKRHFPFLTSISEFRGSDEYLGVVD
ncbi:type III deoxyribonuclease, partial [Candidatus Poribacteria bacterium]|nr:type III deoxyribonuclease [Candidatus Poribacteria bacterium]